MLHRMRGDATLFPDPSGPPEHHATSGTLHEAGPMRPALNELATLLESPAPAVLTTYRRDGSALTTPVWFRFNETRFEVVIAITDVKLRHLERDPRCLLVIFEAVTPFRGIEVRGEAKVTDDPDEVRRARQSIARRYLGERAGDAFTAARAAAVILGLDAAGARTWDLTGILPRGA